MVPRYSGPILSVLAGLAGLTAVALVLDRPLTQLVPFAVALVAVEAYRILESQYDLNRGWVKLPLALAIGVLAVVGGTGDAAVWAIALFVLMSLWLFADGVCDLRYGMIDDQRPADSLRYMADMGAVDRAVRADPRTAEALAADLDQSPERVQAALDSLERQGRIEQTDGIYYPQVEAGESVLTRARRSLRRGSARLARPLRLIR